ncbi:hypothetical protein GGX14DRAFT_394459 [Mycena pura]|uniref:Uncharacterized protein n=1 Tax=Mycena pura TaxID=153505 RepID=A0AAD6YAW6_9AGAR|nr:hypothetical protein GGX14DRAFT_394459 [Mycena pura]
MSLSPQSSDNAFMKMVEGSFRACPKAGLTRWLRGISGRCHMTSCDYGGHYAVQSKLFRMAANSLPRQRRRAVKTMGHLFDGDQTTLVSSHLTTASTPFKFACHVPILKPYPPAAQRLAQLPEQDVQSWAAAMILTSHTWHRDPPAFRIFGVFRRCVVLLPVDGLQVLAPCPPVSFIVSHAIACRRLHPHGSLVAPLRRHVSRTHTLRFLQPHLQGSSPRCHRNIGVVRADAMDRRAAGRIGMMDGEVEGDAGVPHFYRAFALLRALSRHGDGYEWLPDLCTWLLPATRPVHGATTRYHKGDLSTGLPWVFRQPDTT